MQIEAEPRSDNKLDKPLCWKLKNKGEIAAFLRNFPVVDLPENVCLESASAVRKGPGSHCIDVAGKLDGERFSKSGGDNELDRIIRSPYQGFIVHLVDKRAEKRLASTDIFLDLVCRFDGDGHILPDGASRVLGWVRRTIRLPWQKAGREEQKALIFELQK